MIPAYLVAESNLMSHTLRDMVLAVFPEPSLNTISELRVKRHPNATLKQRPANG